MSAAHDSPTFFDPWKAWMWECPSCPWSGRGDELALEHFDALFELHCPLCDHKFAVVTHPSRKQAQQAADAGNIEAIKHLAVFDLVEGKSQEVEESRLTRRNLPSLHGDRLEFTFTTSGGSSWMNPSSLIVSCADTVIHRERSGFEHWQAIIDISQCILDTYPGRVSWIDPGEAGECLLGDDLTAASTIAEFLRDHAVAPPSGEWMREETT